MPNWVHNRLDIHCGDQRRSEIREHLKPPSDSDEHAQDDALTFQALIPRPKELDDDWYNWNVANWGTKWDAAHSYMEETDDALTYHFDTAWACPMPVIAAFHERYPEVAFDYFYEEEQGWGGTLKVRDGKVTEQTEYDVPDSHAEMTRRGNECWCVSSSEAVFDDCYFEQVKERGIVDAETLETVKGISREWSGSIDELIEAATRL